MIVSSKDSRGVIKELKWIKWILFFIFIGISKLLAIQAIRFYYEFWI